MDSVTLDVALLKLRFPELILRPGMQVVARVASRGEGDRGAIVLAGSLLNASLPDQVQAGETLRLTVAETSAERVLLRLDGSQPALLDPGALAAQGPPPPGTAALPPRPDAEEAERRRRNAASATGVTLAYETPALGRLELRIDRDAAGTVVVIGAPAPSAGLAAEGAEELRVALEQRTGQPARVSVRPRQDPFDAYA